MGFKLEISWKTGLLWNFHSILLSRIILKVDNLKVRIENQTLITNSKWVQKQIIVSISKKYLPDFA